VSTNYRAHAHTPLPPIDGFWVHGGDRDGQRQAFVVDTQVALERLLPTEKNPQAAEAFGVATYPPQLVVKIFKAPYYAF